MRKGPKKSITYEDSAYKSSHIQMQESNLHFSSIEVDKIFDSNMEPKKVGLKSSSKCSSSGKKLPSNVVKNRSKANLGKNGTLNKTNSNGSLKHS